MISISPTGIGVRPELLHSKNDWDVPVNPFNQIVEAMRMGGQIGKVPFETTYIEDEGSSQFPDNSTGSNFSSSVANINTFELLEFPLGPRNMVSANFAGTNRSNEDVVSPTYTAAHADRFDEVGVLGHKYNVFAKSTAGEHISNKNGDFSNFNYENKVNTFPYFADEEYLQMSFENRESTYRDTIQIEAYISKDVSLGKSIHGTSGNNHNQSIMMKSAIKSASQNQQSKRVIYDRMDTNLNNLGRDNVGSHLVDGELNLHEGIGRSAQNSSVKDVLTAMPQNSHVQIALYALEKGMRVLARVSHISDKEQPALQKAIRHALAQYGVLGADIVVEGRVGHSLDERTF